MAKEKVKVVILEACFVDGEAHEPAPPKKPPTIVEVSLDDAMTLAGAGRGRLATPADLEKKSGKAQAPAEGGAAGSGAGAPE